MPLYGAPQRLVTSLVRGLPCRPETASARPAGIREAVTRDQFWLARHDMMVNRGGVNTRTDLE